MNKLKAGTKVKLVHPDGADLMQGLTQGIVGTVVERLQAVHHRSQPYDNLVLVRFECMSDNHAYVMMLDQLEVVGNEIK